MNTVSKPVSKYAVLGYGLETGRRKIPKPTRATPGSDRKMAVLSFRARHGYEMWHPMDARFGSVGDDAGSELAARLLMRLLGEGGGEDE